jgi:hypothetical protein
MKVRPYKLFGTRERTVIAAYFAERLRAWASAWLPPEAAVFADCAPAIESDLRDRASSVSWVRYGGSLDEWIAISLSGASEEVLGAALCGNAESSMKAIYTDVSELIRELAGRAMDELGATLVGEPSKSLQRQEGELATPEPETWMRGSAALVVKAHLGHALLECVSNPSFTMRMMRSRLPPPRRGQLIERPGCIASRKVGLKVVAGWVQLDVRSLKELAVGNVITLDSRIDEPMSVVVATNREPTVCAARLGMREGRRVVTLGGAMDRETR